jgi:glutamine synthetase
VTEAGRTRVLFSDLLGLSHGKVVPSDRADDPTHYAMTVMVQGLDLEFVELPGYAAESGYPDMEARVVPGTERPGWRTRAGPGARETVAIAELSHTDGRPFGLDGRQALRRAIEPWTARGLEPRCGFEMEFYLLSGPTPSDGPLDVPWHRVYGTGPGADPSGLLEDVLERTERSRLLIHGVNGEFHAGQAEAALHHLPAVEAADAAFLFKELVRETAFERGAGVTFMARPFADRIGNGLHLNLSASRGDGANAFDDPHDADGISALCRHAVGGLLDHHESLAAVFAPTVNSYKRLQPRLLSGYWATWGLDNRIATVRIPGQRGKATRIEHRTPDGTANPYLALAAMLAAAMDGIERDADPNDPQTGDGDARPVSDRHTPHSLSEALDAFEKDLVLRTALGDDLCDAFVAIKRQEVERWNRAVTDWEQAEYGRVY